MGRVQNMEMLDSLRQTNRQLQGFISGAVILPEIKVRLLPLYRLLAPLIHTMSNNLENPNCSIIQKELDFIQQIQMVLTFGMYENQEMTIEGTHQLMVYLREKNALYALEQASSDASPLPPSQPA